MRKRAIHQTTLCLLISEVAAEWLQAFAGYLHNPLSMLWILLRLMSDHGFWFFFSVKQISFKSFLDNFGQNLYMSHGCATPLHFHFEKTLTKRTFDNSSNLLKLVWRHTLQLRNNNWRLGIAQDGRNTKIHAIFANEHIPCAIHAVHIKIKTSVK